MADRLAQPIATAWVSTGDTGARNYDEFNSYADVEAAIVARPTSILTVDMPHCTPADRAAGRSFFDALPAAPTRLRQLKEGGHFARHDHVVLPYRITSGPRASYGVWVMVATDEISASAGDPGRVIRNEEVFAEKVRERLALTQAVGHLLSAVLLVRADGGDELVGALREWCEGHPAASHDVDDKGQTHEVWVVGPGPHQDRLLDLAGGGELIVADGNHRSLAAQEAGLPAFLAVVAAAESLTIEPYDRLLRELPMPVGDLPAALRQGGFEVRETSVPPRTPAQRGHVTLYLAGGTAYDVVLPPSEGSVADRIDHAVVERALLRGVLGLAPDDPRIAYVGGDYGPGWLQAEVDGGRAAAAVLMAPVSTDDFVRVNHERMTMPRKSTWFTPKARAGLVLAEL